MRQITSSLEDRFSEILHETLQHYMNSIVPTGYTARLPEILHDYRWHTERRWRFDFAIPTANLAIEVEGGIFVKGAHSSGVGISRDIEKYNEATLCGWHVIRVTSNMIKDKVNLAKLIERCLKLWLRNYG